MTLPIQRVPRYRSLLKQVLLYTCPGDADYKLMLKESIKKIEDTISHISISVAAQEAIQNLTNLQYSMAHSQPLRNSDTTWFDKNDILNPKDKKFVGLS